MNTVGILDPDGINLNPLTNEPYSELYKELAKKWKEFPAYKKASQILKSIEDNQIILITSGTGSGKTVLLPKFVLHTLNYKGKVAITLPKQLIAKSAAEFAAKTLDVKLGEEVGYQYKGSDKRHKSENTKLLYATDGTIVARLLNDIELKDFDAVVIDEAHERKVQIDFLLYLLRFTIEKRKDFKLIIMSATVNAEIFKSYFKDYSFSQLDIGGETNYPIESIFLTSDIGDAYMSHGGTLIRKILQETSDGDILFFVASVNETKEICRKLRDFDDSLFCVELYSGIKPEVQDLAQDLNKYKQVMPEKKTKIGCVDKCCRVVSYG